jgi:hypothetical protein
MKLEDKELLFKDLCARLPYSTLCYCKWTKDAPNGTSGCVQEVSTYLLEELMIIDDQNYECQICEIKPYLRPMSSMTDEEYEQYRKFSYYGAAGYRNNDYKEMVATPSFEKMDFLNAHHFDYRGLIEKGLAIAVTEEKPL